MKYRKHSIPSKFRCLYLFFVLLSSTVFAQTYNDSHSPDWLKAFEAEAEAEELAKQWKGDAVRRSANLFLSASSQWNQIGENEKASQCLREFARQKTMLGESINAANALNQNLEIHEKKLSSIERIKIYSTLSAIYSRSGQTEKTNSYSKKAFILSESIDDMLAQAIYGTSLAEIYYERKQVDKSLAEYRTALSAWQKSGDLRGETDALLAISYVYMSKGEILAALESAEQAHLSYKQIGDKRGEVLSKIAVGMMNSKLDNKQTALNAFQNAEKLFPNDIDLLEKGDLYNSLAEIYSSYGEMRMALNYHLKAYELYEREQNPYAKLATLPSLAILSHKLNEKDSAFKYFETGFQLAKQLRDNYFYSVLLEESGNIYLKEDKDKAINYYLQALHNFEKLGFIKRKALIQKNLGEIYLEEGQLTKAADYLESSLTLNREIKNKFAEAATLFNLAKLNAVENRNTQALELTSESLSLTEMLSSEVVNSKLKSIYFSNVVDRYELYTNLLMKMNKQSPNEDYAIQALQATEKSRARSMLENLALNEAAFTKDAPPEIVRREKEIRVFLNSKADRLTDLLSSKADKTETDKLDNEINELEHELEAIKGRLRQISPVYSAIKNPVPFDVGEFQRNVLDDNSLLLEFSFGKEESYLWLVGKTEINSYVLPPREHLESRIENLRKLIDSRGIIEGEAVEDYQARIAAAETAFARESEIFSRELLGQVADKIKDKRLLIVPDGKLHYFPIAALPFPGSIDNTPILLTNETIYEPSAATLALIMRNGIKTSAATKNLLVFSDPIFSNQDARVTAGTEIKPPPEINSLKAETFRFAESLTSLARLNASREEADSIVQIVGESSSTALNGAAATRERALDASVSDYKIIHFATHGFISEERPELSGIVLSQVDQNGQSRNGVVRLQDIYTMNLSADAVILSACSTGIGKEVKGEGLLSLNNAFLQTGAKSVVSSLWKVDDYAAQELMKNFYQEMTSGTATTAEALRRAQIKLRQKPQYQSPFYWAAFTIEGDFQNVPQISRGFDYRIYGLLIFPFALTAIYIYRRRFNLFNRKIINNS